MSGRRGKAQKFIGARSLATNGLTPCKGNHFDTAQQNYILLPHNCQVIPAGLISKWDESCIWNLKIQYFCRFRGSVLLPSLSWSGA